MLSIALIKPFSKHLNWGLRNKEMCLSAKSFSTSKWHSIVMGVKMDIDVPISIQPRGFEEVFLLGGDASTES